MEQLALRILLSSDIKFNIWQGFGLINIRPLADEWDGKSGSVKVMDMSGKTVSDLQNVEFSKNSVHTGSVSGSKRIIFY